MVGAINVPLLMKLLCCLVNKAENNKPLVCTIASMLLKFRCPSMCLVQRAISVVFYGSGVGKKVHFYLALLVFFFVYVSC